MDSVYVITQTPPKELSAKEMVVSQPSFLDEVRASHKRKGSRATLGPNYLRAIAEEIGRRYDKAFNPFRNVVPTDYTGRAAATDEDVAQVVHEMFQARYPVIYQRYYESVVRARPFSVRVIYFTGKPEDAEFFRRLGIPQIDESEVYAHLGTQKPAAKPASAAKPVPKRDEEVSKTLEALANSVPPPAPEKPAETPSAEAQLPKPVQRQSALKRNRVETETPVVTAQKQT